MASAGAPDSRNRRLGDLFKKVLSGTREVRSEQAARQFLEAVCSQPQPAVCVESILASPAGGNALRDALRINMSAAFIHASVIAVLRYLAAAPNLGLLANGALLQQLLVSMAQPPTLWRALCQHVHDDPNARHQHRDSLVPFAWFAYALLCLPASSGVDVTADVQALLQAGHLLDESAPVEARQTAYQMKQLLQIRATATTTPATVAAMAPLAQPGGRHDNDFADFRAISIYPTAAEILSSQRPFLRRADEVFAAAPDVRAGLYIDNQFRLLRESMLASLREGVQVAIGLKKPRRAPLVLGRLALQGVSGSGSDKKMRAVKCSVVLTCRQGLEALAKQKDEKARLAYLKTHASLLRNQAFGVLVRGKAAVVGFAFVERAETLLAQAPPQVCLQFTDRPSLERALHVLRAPGANDAVRFVLMDTAVFAFAPILARLRELVAVPLERLVLHTVEEQSEAAAAEDQDASNGGETRFLPDASVREFTLALMRQGKGKVEGEVTVPNLPGITADKPTMLDPSQRDALVSGLSNRLSLIQGPPGTGKSFVGAMLVKALFCLTKKRILITTYTNHALDQCLGDLIKMGISTHQMVRLGFKAAPETEALKLTAQASKYRRPQEEYQLMDAQRDTMKYSMEQLDDAVKAYRNFHVSFDALMEYLDFSDTHAHFTEAFTVPAAMLNGADSPSSPSAFQTVGRKGQKLRPDYLFEAWKSGRKADILKLFPQMGAPGRQAWKLPRNERQALLRTWEQDLVQEQAQRVGELVEQHDGAVALLGGLQAEKKKATLQERRIIGCTTTGAAMYADLLAAARPDVVLVEEAGEILECQVLTALGPSVEQAVLIGDHKQLRPKVDCYALTAEQGGGYDLNVSLFERLITQPGSYPHTTLHKQHRMVPEVSIFSREDTYPEMVDAPKTQGRPPLRGLSDRVVFVNHDHAEDADSKVADRADAGATTSRSNRFEAQLALACVRYFRQQGYATASMVVLTPYLGQLRLLLDLLASDRELAAELNDLDAAEMARAGLLGDSAGAAKRTPLRVSTIDNYQGEESDIVIVSLTRCNENGDIGFMASPQRVNVMRTRSRDCLVMLGSAATFLASRKGRDVWRPFLTSLADKAHLYDGLPVRCEQHPDTTARPRTPADFLQHCPDGGCERPCDAPMACGLHACGRRCHRKTENDADHAEMRCTEDVAVTCDRGHERRVPCAKRKSPCHERPCGAPMACGLHKCRGRCHRKTDNDADHAETRCTEDVSVKCDRGHERRMPCCDKRLNSCQTCRDEDEALRRRAARDLELEKARRKQQAVYAAKLQALDDEIAHQKLIAKVARDEEAAKETLRTRQQDLEAAKNTASKLAEKKKREKETKQAKAAAAPAGPPAWMKSKAADEWAALKAEQGAQNEAMDKMMTMVGLEEVKQEFLDLKARVDLCARQDVALDTERFGCVLLGNPGTGKTTVARLLAKFLSDVGIVPGTEFKETTGAALANGGVSGCQTLIDEVLNKGGGVVFIDEAYQLAPGGGGGGGGGGAVLDYLLPEVENLRGKVVFVLAGYSREMEGFFGHNPGLASRFPTTLRFADYTDTELLHMLRLKVDAKYKGRMQAEGGWEGLYARIVARRVGRGRGRPGFGNARALENALDMVYKRQARRLREAQQAARRAAKKKGAAADAKAADKAAASSEFRLTKEDLIGPEPQQVLQDCKPWKELQAMVGLRAVKEAVRALIDTVQQNYARELAEDPPVAYSLNKLFLGGPGTGKTTVAKLYGGILVQLGLLSKDEVVIKTPADFVGAVLGQSEKQTKSILAASVGKVLVIDEAYGLYAAADPYKTAVVDTIVAEVQSVAGDDRCVLLLGYADQMETMLEKVNPGLSRRFPLASAFVFDDFDDGELQTILDLKLKKQAFAVTDEARRVVAEMLSRARNRPNFGNGGEVDILLDQAKTRQQRRLAQARTDKATDGPPSHVLEAVDFDEHFDRVHSEATDVRRLFADTVGQEAVVAQLVGYQETVRAMRAHGMDARGAIPFTFLFTGPPGTGKTTTAAKIGQVFYDLGFLATAAVEICSVTDLVGQFVGQTGPKMQEQLDRALGRVLFIDEAYRLADSVYGKEAAGELVDALTKDRYRQRLVVILAGYTADIDRLLATNAGLASRFSERVEFFALAPTACVDLLGRRLRAQQAALQAGGSASKLRLDALDTAQATGLHDRLVALFAALAQQSNWGSARDVGTLAQGIFNEAIRSSSGSSSGANEVVVTAQQMERALQAMLDERRSQTANQAQSSLLGRLFGHQEQQSQEQQDEQKQPNMQQIQETETAPPSTGPDEERTVTLRPKTEPAPAPHGRAAVRDAGVSDAVWDQLQRDRQAMEARQRAHARLQAEAAAATAAAAADAGDAALEARRQAIITELIAAEEKRKQEAAAQKRLKASGRCPMGYDWVPQEGGWRCSGGSHFVQDLPES